MTREEFDSGLDLLESLPSNMNTAYRIVNLSAQYIQGLESHIKELELFKSEHLRLEAELNAILHPNGDGPTAPSFCDLVSYVRNDITVKLCGTCTRDHCGCSIQDSILQIEPEATFDTFGCVHHEFNALLTEPSKHSTIQH